MKLKLLFIAALAATVAFGQFRPGGTAAAPEVRLVPITAAGTGTTNVTLTIAPASRLRIQTVLGYSDDPAAKVTVQSGTNTLASLPLAAGKVEVMSEKSLWTSGFGENVTVSLSGTNSVSLIVSGVLER